MMGGFIDVAINECSNTRDFRGIIIYINSQTGPADS